MADNYYQTQTPIQNSSASDMVYTQQAQEKKISDILEQLNPDALIVEIEHRIRRFRKDPYTKQWIPIASNVTPVSSFLVSNFISGLSAFLTNNVTMSNFSDKEINKIMTMVKQWLIDDFKENAVNYQLVGLYSERTRIGLIVGTAIFSALKRAQNGMEGRRLFASLDISQKLGGQNHQGGGIADKLKFWK